MSLPALYTLTSEIRALEHLLGSDEELDEHALEAIRTTLDALALDIRDKGLSVAAYALNLEAYAQAANEASKALHARSMRIKRRADALREYLKINLEAAGIPKLEGPQFTLAIRKNPPSVLIEPETTLPERYMVQPPAPPPHPDKRAIADALKAGENIDGCSLVQSTRLDIRA